MPGKKITDQQVRKYKEARRQATQQIAAARMGISVRSARRIEQADGLPSQRGPRTWRTRADPLADVWGQELVPLLEREPGLQGRTLLEELQRRHGDVFGDEVLRTLQRRIRMWRAEHGHEKEVFFSQANPPGRLALSDFTVCDELRITVGGEHFAHRLYQFALAYSGWRHAELVCGGESFAALAQGLQNALWALGGVPEEHRTDSLSAAFNNLAEAETLTRRYKDLCRHYGMRPSRNNLGQSHENGAIESRQGSLKGALEQALLLRGHREFATPADYRRFVAEVVARLNRRVQTRLAEERSQLTALPVRRTSEYEETEARVTKFSTVSIRRVLYSVPSRLAGQRLKVRLYSAHLEAWLGGVKVFECERLHASKADRHPKRIDWRHMLPSLRAKPGAFARWVLRDAMFPRSEYARAWECISQALPERAACRLMVDLLDLADRANVVAQLAMELARLMDQAELPDIDVLRDKFAPRPPQMPEVAVVLPTAAVYDELLEAA